MNRLAVVAYHEAGHALAARMRGGTVVSVSLDPGLTTWNLPRKPTKLFHHGQRIEDPEPIPQYTNADGFVFYAGSWAQVRCGWQMPTLDEPDHRGVSFLDRVNAVLVDNDVDHAGFLASGEHSGLEAQWSAELEQNWPYLHRVATALYREHLDKLTVQREKRRRRIDRQRARQLGPVQNRRTVDGPGIVTVGR